MTNNKTTEPSDANVATEAKKAFHNAAMDFMMSDAAEKLDFNHFSIDADKKTITIVC